MNAWRKKIDYTGEGLHKPAMVAALKRISKATNGQRYEGSLQDGSILIEALEEYEDRLKALSIQSKHLSASLRRSTNNKSTKILLLLSDAMLKSMDAPLLPVMNRKRYIPPSV